MSNKDIVRAGFLKHGYRLGCELGEKTPALIGSIKEQMEQGNIDTAMVLISVAACKQHITILVPDNTKDINKFLYGLSLSQEEISVVAAQA
jgi:hypothetical protein